MPNIIEPGRLYTDNERRAKFLETKFECGKCHAVFQFDAMDLAVGTVSVQTFGQGIYAINFWCPTCHRSGRWRAPEAPPQPSDRPWWQRLLDLIS